MVKFVDSKLEFLKKEVNEMWTLVYNQMELAKNAVLNHEKEPADTIIIREKRVNSFDLKIDSDVEDFIALYNPVAVDLRFALSVLNINNNLERIGDYAEGMARYTLRTEKETTDKVLLVDLRLEEMFNQTLYMLSAAQKAFQEEDIELAKSILDKDNLLDEINANSTRTLANYTVEHPEMAKQCFELTGIFRKLERTGDHINNMIEEIVFYVNAKVLKHSGKKEEMN
ncbi:MAG: phosphate signaling complex protein PhoU [Bacteroidaceae bacterium]|jgi:phosphate transport system protein